MPGPKGDQGPAGPASIVPGPRGFTGQDGAPGVGVGGRGLPVGGVEGQIPQIDGNGAPAWMRGIPTGGSENEVLGIGASGLEWVRSGNFKRVTTTSFPNDFTNIVVSSGTTANDIRIGGFTSDGTTMWVGVRTIDANQFSSAKLVAYNLSTKERDSAKDITIADQTHINRLEHLITDGTTIWIVDNNSDDHAYAYNLQTKARDTAKDITFAGDGK